MAGGERLKPCPFCGASGESIELEDFTRGDGSLMYLVRCRLCFAEGPVYHLGDTAMEKWNTRHDGVGLPVLIDDPLCPLSTMASVSRGHCNRCDRCGWEMSTKRGSCAPDDCSQRPLEPYRLYCAGCGATYADGVVLSADTSMSLPSENNADNRPAKAIATRRAYDCGIAGHAEDCDCRNGLIEKLSDRVADLAFVVEQRADDRIWMLRFVGYEQPDREATYTEVMLWLALRVEKLERAADAPPATPEVP